MPRVTKTKSAGRPRTENQVWVANRPVPGLKWGVLQNTQKADMLHATSTVAIRGAIVKRETKKVGCCGMKMKRYNHPNLGVRLVRRGILVIYRRQSRVVPILSYTN